MTHTEEEEAQYAKHLLSRADKILAQIDDSFIIKERNHRIRPMPVFRPEEISLGSVLGTGGFGIVNEIKAFFLDEDTSSSNSPEEKKTEASNDIQASDSNLLEASDSNAQENSGELVATSTERTHHLNRVNQDSEFSVTHVHYDVTKARHLMERKATRNGTARYALKRLHGVLTELERARGMIDLATEAKYLSVVWHPNIIKMRGMATGPMVDKDFFIILDRLFETLDIRLAQWCKQEKTYGGKLFGIGKKKFALRELLVDRMTIAYDLAAAFMYLHENRLVYRDIKPENIGFDVRGDVKVFDFGLCKSLSSRLKAKEGYGYRLTGRAGSLPYMAPEVVKSETYDTKCDVFSFAILLWEILSLKQAFKTYSATKFVNKVVVAHERLPIDKSWPPLTRLMIPEAWDKDPRSRPDMKRVAILIRGDLNDMTTDERVLRRTRHMDERSNHSIESGDFDLDDLGG